MNVRMQIDVVADEQVMDRMRELLEVEGRVQVSLGVNAHEQLTGVFRGATQVHAGASIDGH